MGVKLQNRCSVIRGIALREEREEVGLLPPWLHDGSLDSLKRHSMIYIVYRHSHAVTGAYFLY